MYQSDGQIKLAVDLLEHVVAVEGRTLDEEHPDRLASQEALKDAKWLKRINETYEYLAY